jgi:spore coat polysaccharide biosynthesis protein SpsF
VRTFPRGLDVEVFSFKVLEKAFIEARKDYQREHVTPYIYQNPDIFKLECFKNNEDLSFHRWTVDEKEDLCLIREIYRELYNEDRYFLFHEIIDLFKKKPQLLEINANVKQKKLGE